MVNKMEISAYSGPWVSEVWDMEDLRAIWGPSWRVIWRVNLRVILGHSEVILGPYLRKPQETS